MAINAKRLLKLADFLETIPRKSFDLARWQASEPTKPEGKKQGDCGFAGCAIGWATHGQLFRGLRFVFDEGFQEMVPFYNGTEGWSGIDELFALEPVDHDIDSGQAEYLFTDTSYPSLSVTPKQVATRIRKFVREHASATP